MSSTQPLFPLPHSTSTLSTRLIDIMIVHMAILSQLVASAWASVLWWPNLIYNSKTHVIEGRFPPNVTSLQNRTFPVQWSWGPTERCMAVGDKNLQGESPIGCIQSTYLVVFDVRRLDQCDSPAGDKDHRCWVARSPHLDLDTDVGREGMWSLAGVNTTTPWDADYDETNDSDVDGFEIPRMVATKDLGRLSSREYVATEGMCFVGGEILRRLTVMKGWARVTSSDGNSTLWEGMNDKSKSYGLRDMVENDYLRVSWRGNINRTFFGEKPKDCSFVNITTVDNRTERMSIRTEKSTLKKPIDQYGPEATRDDHNSALERLVPVGVAIVLGIAVAALF